MADVILQTRIPNVPVRHGKVRDIYDLGDKMLLAASDRISAFDVIMRTGIPYKGQVLNQLSAFWFDQTADIVENHLIAVPDPNVTVARENVSLEERVRLP